jgi:phage-related protein|nr:MAG TPA: Minor tail protein [Caudoviricetes sp.]
MAGQADGSIVVDTELQTEGFDKGSREMQRAIGSLQTKVNNLAPTMKKAMRGSASALESFDGKVGPMRETISALEEKLEQLGKARLPTEDYQWLQTEIAKAEKELDKLLNKEAAYEDLDVSKSSQKWKTLQYSIEQTERKLEEYRAEAAQMEENGTSHTSGADSAEYDQLSTALDAVKEKLDGMVQKVERGTSAFAKFGSIIGKGVVGGLKGMVSMLGKGAAAMLKLSLRAKKTHSSFNNGIGTLLRYGLGVRSLFALMNKLRSALVDGYKNLARYSSRTNAAISSLMSALTRLKNSFAAAFDPILRAAAPALVTLINLISNAVSKIGMLTAALTGAKTYTKATTIQEDYAKSLDKTSQSAKKAKAALASFDELNILDDNSSDSTKDDGSVDPSKMFEQVPIDSAVLDFADKLKKAFEEADWKGLGTLLGDKINELVDSVDWSGWGTKIGKGMNAAIQTLYYTVDTVNWVNIGKHLAEAVNGIINEVDWDIFGRLLAKKFTVALDVAGGFLKELDWTAVLQAFTSGFSGFYSELQEWLESKDWHRIGEIITAKLSDALRNGNVEGAVKSFFDAFTEAINSLADLMDGIDFYQVAKDLVEMLIRAVSGVSWDELTEALGRLIGESVDAVIQILAGSLADVGNYFKEKTQEVGGDAVAGFFLGIKDAIFGVGAWIVDNIFKPFWDGICAAFEIHSPSKKMAEIGGYIIAGLLDGIKDLPSKLKAKLDDALDKVVSWGSDLKSKVKDAAADAVSKAVDEFKDLASKLKLKLDAAIDKVKGFAKDIASRMKSGTADAVADAASQLGNLAGKAKEKFDNTIARAKSFATGLISKLKGGAADAVSSAASQLATMPQKVKEKLDLVIQKAVSFAADLKEKFTSAGKNALAGIINGISSKIEEVKTSISNVGLALINTFKTLLGIHSPSRVFAEQGGFIAAGLIIGMEGATDDVKKAAAQLAGAAVDAATDAVAEVAPTTLEKIKENLEKIEDAFDDDTGLGKIYNTIKNLFSIDWSDIDTSDILELAKNITTLFFDSLDKNVRLSISDFINTSLDYLNKAYEQEGLPGLIKAGKTIISGLASGMAEGIKYIVANSGQIFSALKDGILVALQGVNAELLIAVGVIALIAVAIAGAWKYSEQFRDSVLNAVNRIKKAVEKVMAAIKKALTPIVELVKNVFTMLQGLIAQLFELVGSILAKIIDWIAPVITIIGNFLSDVITVLGTIIGYIAKLLTPLINGIGKIISTILECLQKIWNTLSDALSPAFEAIWKVVSKIFETIGNLLQTIVDALSPAIDALAEAFGIILDAVASIVSAVVDALAPVIQVIAEALGGIITVLAEIVGAVVDALAPAIKLIGDVLGAIFGVIAKIVNLVCGVLKPVIDVICGALKAIGDVINNIFNGVKNLTSKAVETGKNIIQGIGTGIKNAATGLWNGIKNVGNNIVNGFKNFFGIHSPSKLMASEIGEYLPAGIDEGMKDAMPALLSSAEDQMGNLVDTVKDGAAEANGAIAGSGMPLLSEVSGKVDIVDGLDDVLTRFSDKVADSFTSLLDRLTEITQSANFFIPAVATGMVTPYGVSGSAGGGSGNVVEEIHASNEETTRTIVQAIGSATNSICAAVEQYSGVEVSVDADSLSQHTVDYINRKTRMFGTSPLLTPTEV